MRIKGLDITKYAKVAELTQKHSNLPERYIRRTLEEVNYKAPNLPQYRQIVDKRIKNNFELYRSWQIQFQIANAANQKKKLVYVEPIKEWTIFRGDRVEILKGKDKGKQGIVFRIVQERNWVFVEGLNMYLKDVSKFPQIGYKYLRLEAPLMVTTDVALVDPGDLKPVKVSWRYNEAGERVRVSERTGRVIPISGKEDETYDYKTKSTYLEKDKDTPGKEVTRITFEPSLQTFEMSIMEEMGIKEDRVPAKVFWY